MKSHLLPVLIAIVASPWIPPVSAGDSENSAREERERTAVAGETGRAVSKPPIDLVEIERRRHPDR